MKSTLPKSFFVSLVMMGALMPYAHASDPIPGVDVKLGRNPPGKTATSRTDKNGKVVFADLEVGKYWFELGPQTQNKASINTTRSNIKHSSIIPTNGGEEQTLSIEFGQGNDPKPLGPVQFEVKTKPGKVTVVFTRAATPAPGGGKPADARPAAPKKADAKASGEANTALGSVNTARKN